MPGVLDATQEKGAGREEDSTKAEASKSPDPSDDDLSADLSISNIVGAENVACKGWFVFLDKSLNIQSFRHNLELSHFSSLTPPTFFSLRL